MNRFTLAIFLTSLLALPVAQAAEEVDHSAHHPAADPAQADSVQEDKTAAMGMEKMQEKMKKMQELMSKMHSTSDPKEREKLMKEHMQSMRESMKSMHAMMEKGGMMGKKKPQGDASAGKEAHQHESDSASAGPANSQKGGGMMMMHKKMEARMDALQKMMEQIIEREAIEQQMEGR